MSGTESAAGDASGRLVRRVLWMFFLVFGSIALFIAIIIGDHYEREYRSATTTSATIDECRTEDHYITFQFELKKHVSCAGSWNFDGQRHEGRIDGNFDDELPSGTQVPVRATDSKAYAMTYDPPGFLFAYVLGGFLAVVAVALVAWGRRAKRRNRPTLGP